jgi:hypothetical protein
LIPKLLQIDPDDMGLDGLFMVIGAIAFVIRLLAEVGFRFSHRGCVRLEGAVVDHESYPHRGTTYHTPIVEYATPTGEKRRINMDMGYPEPRPSACIAARSIPRGPGVDLLIERIAANRFATL